MLFFAYFSVSKKRNIKRSPNGMKPSGRDFWNERDPRNLECKPGKRQGSHKIGGRAHPPGCALPSHGPLEAPLTNFFHLYKPTYPKNIEIEDRSGLPLSQASVATKNLSGARSGTLPEGGSLTGGHHLHHPGAIHDKEGVVYPRG